MLVLTRSTARRRDRSVDVVIDNKIVARVSVERITGKRVRLGFVGDPSAVRFVRSEISDAIADDDGRRSVSDDDSPSVELDI